MAAVLTVTNLTYTYPGAPQPAVRDVSFALGEGEILGFLGPNGAGKSTTQRVITRLLKGYSGQVSVFGRELRQWGHHYYTNIGVSFELPNHYLKLTALENLNYFASLYEGEKEDPRKLLAMVDLADDADTMVGNYSKGMKMRLNFVRSLLHRPRLLFLDEPTSGLDPVSARTVKDIILGLRRSGVTVFLTTHDMTAADELSDRVAFIVGGRIAALDSPRTLKLRHGKREVAVEYDGAGGELTRRTFSLDGLGENPAFLEVLRRERIATLHSQETTLEQIFLQVTGRGLQ
ncbi:MAG: ABC transporter ATP-binding protein [Chloroflexota bacterium]